jgi:hypothetical protein
MEGNHPRLLIVTRGLATLRGHYEDVIVNLSRAGVRVSVRYVREKWLDADEYRQTLLRRGCEVELNPLPPDKRKPGGLLALRLRQLANLLRYFHPDYRGREWLREFWFSKAATGPARWAGRIGRLGSVPSMAAIRVASSVDRVLPPTKRAWKILHWERPDAVVAVGTVWMPEFVDLLKAASWQHIPTANWIQSWDNLTNKGLLHFSGDRVFVWNAVQRDELARYHAIPADSVCITGAQTFDHWFAEHEALSRADFCARYGLDSERPILLYLASSRQIEPPPTDFFLRWLDALRSSDDEVLAAAAVLVRPHPTHVKPWLELARQHPGLSVSPSTADAPINSAAYRERFRNELHHASAAVGLNTSAMIDAAILGKPVCTVELPDIPNRQRGTVHFEYLITVGGGFVRTARSFDEHFGVLAELVRKDPYERDEQSDRFVRAFVRPHGLGVVPASVFSEEMVRLLREGSGLAPPNRLGRGIGRLLHRAAPALGGLLADESPHGRPEEKPWRPETAADQTSPAQVAQP